jgi:hypothetical protein
LELELASKSEPELELEPGLELELEDVVERVHDRLASIRRRELLQEVCRSEKVHSQVSSLLIYSFSIPSFPFLFC